jgi:hypothetical protein
MVQRELLPIVIAFVGAENMFNLVCLVFIIMPYQTIEFSLQVDAVGRTSVTLSVKQRIAGGLSRAGTSNTLKVVFYNAILGVIAFFSVGAVRQFCTFAIVVLVAHWFLAHTFFMAVLSIDIQRLEVSFKISYSQNIVNILFFQLEELLRHDSSLAPPLRQTSKDRNSKQPRSGWQKLMMMVQNLLKGRAATNISLLMVWLQFFTCVAAPELLYTAPRDYSHSILYNILLFNI